MCKRCSLGLSQPCKRVWSGMVGAHFFEPGQKNVQGNVQGPELHRLERMGAPRVRRWGQLARLLVERSASKRFEALRPRGQSEALRSASQPVAPACSRCVKFAPRWESGRCQPEAGAWATTLALAPLCAPPGPFSTAYSRRALGEREPEERAAAILPPGPRTGPREARAPWGPERRGGEALRSFPAARAHPRGVKEAPRLEPRRCPPEDGRRVPFRLCASPARPSSRGSRQARRVRGEGACQRSCAFLCVASPVGHGSSQGTRCRAETRPRALWRRGVAAAEPAVARGGLRRACRAPQVLGGVGRWAHGPRAPRGRPLRGAMSRYDLETPRRQLTHAVRNFADRRSRGTRQRPDAGELPGG